MARESWTDERLDDLVKRIDKGFDASKVEIRDLRASMDKGFGEVKAEIREAKVEIREAKGEVAELRQEMNARFDSMQRTLIACFAGLAGSIASAIGALLATQL